MTTKIIDGKTCKLRDVVYNDFGAVTTSEKIAVEMKSSEEYKSNEARKGLFEDLEYSWNDNRDNTYDYFNEDDLLESNDTNYSEELDKEFSTGTLPARLITLKKPLHIQLKNLYREHSRVYKSKGSTLKNEEVKLLMEDFRYELHRIILVAKNQILESGGSMDIIMKVSSIKGGNELQKTLRQLTILLKRIDKSYNKFGFIPRNQQSMLSTHLNILISHFVLDIYGPFLEKLKMESMNEDTKEPKNK